MKTDNKKDLVITFAGIWNIISGQKVIIGVGKRKGEIGERNGRLRFSDREGDDKNVQVCNY